jgi:hypothetical protein
MIANYIYTLHRQNAKLLQTMLPTIFEDVPLAVEQQTADLPVMEELNDAVNKRLRCISLSIIIFTICCTAFGVIVNTYVGDLLPTLLYGTFATLVIAMIGLTCALITLDDESDAPNSDEFENSGQWVIVLEN